MRPLAGFRQLQIEQKLVQELGDGNLRGDRHLFDQLTMIPEGWTTRYGTPSELLDMVSRIGEVLVLFDRHPDNLRWVVECLTRSGLPAVAAAHVTTEELRPLLACNLLDMYITTVQGELLAIACHEDREVDGVRQIWMPVRRG